MKFNSDPYISELTLSPVKGCAVWRSKHMKFNSDPYISELTLSPVKGCAVWRSKHTKFNSDLIHVQGVPALSSNMQAKIL